jgi:hypothetical protein
MTRADAFVPSSRPDLADPARQSAVRAAAATAGIPIHIEYCEK